MDEEFPHIVRHDQNIDQVVDTFFNQINNPVLGNLSLHWEGPGESPSFYPMAIPDLFAEQPLVLFGRKQDSQSGTLVINGIEAGGKSFQQSLQVQFNPSGNAAIAQLWGRARIKDLMNQMVRGETTGGVDAVTKTALAYQLLSQYTAFVAVSDDVRVKNPETLTSVNVPVLMPEAISHEGVFGAAAPLPMRARMARPVAQRELAQRPPHLGGLFKRRTKAEKEETFTTMPADAIAPPQSPLESANIFEEVTQTDPTISASMATDDNESVPIMPAAASPQTSQSPTSSEQIHILQATGLTDQIRDQLEQHLQRLQLTAPQMGKLIFVLVIQTGRVKRTMLDEAASDSQSPETIEQIRQALVAWRCQSSLTETVRLEIMVQT